MEHETEASTTPWQAWAEALHDTGSSNDDSPVGEGVDANMQQSDPQPSASTASISWMIKPPSLDPDPHWFWGFIIGVFSKASTKLDFKIRWDGAEPERITPTHLMCLGDRFELRVDNTFSDNTIHPSRLEGAGVLRPAHGHEPLLMMIFLQSRFEDEVLRKDYVTLSDDEGNSIDYISFSSLETIIDRMGYDYDAVRSDAAKLGLASEQVKWSQLESTIDNGFF